MKKITINYLSHKRLNFSDLTFYFLKKIKKENKNIVKINILATSENDWVNKCNDLGIDYNIHIINGVENYLKKIKIATCCDTEYSVKLDEDCFMNNYVWDYLIENVNMLDDDNILTLSPTMSNNIPSCDYFIEDFIIDGDVKNKIFNFFLGRDMPNGLWGVNYQQLNKYTLKSSKWNFEDFYDGVRSLNTIVRGIHPLRISYEAQIEINDYILKNINSFLSKNDFRFITINAPYFTNSLFFIKTSEWKNILNHPTIDRYDEIALNKYSEDKNKKFLFVKNGFAIHPTFNTVHGNKNKWGIGMEDGLQYENNFYYELKNKIEKI